MATKLSPATPRPKLQRGSSMEGERISPAAKTGAKMLGDNSPKATRSPRPFSTEKKSPVSRGAELQQVQEELAKTKEQLSLMEKSKSNLVQDLARSKRQLEDLTSKLQDANEVSKKDRLRAEEMERASFTAAEDWQAELETMKKQYEGAVLDLQTTKQAMESLKNELVVCVEAKDEAVRLAGEAMNAAESTAKRVEEMSVELLAAKGSAIAADSASARIDELLTELSRVKECLVKANTAGENCTKEAATLLAAKEEEIEMAVREANIARSELDRVKQELALIQRSVIEQTGGNDAVEQYQTQLAAAKEVEKNSQLQNLNLMSQLDQLRMELDDAKVAENKATSELANMRSELEQLRGDLVAAKEATETTCAAESAAIACVNKLNADIARVRDSELVALASLADTSEELEEAQENLAKAVLEGTMLAAFLDSVKGDLEGSQVQLVIVEEKAAHANMKVGFLTIELNKCMEENQREVMLLNEQVLNAHAALESLKVHVERQRLELLDTLNRESLANDNVTGLNKRLEDVQIELADLKKQESNASEKSILLAKQLETSLKQISEMKESELDMAAKTTLLMQEFEVKQLELSELSRNVGISDSNAVALKMDLENAKAELLELKEREYCSGTKATVLSVVLASLMETSESSLNELKLKERHVSEKVISLKAELNKTNVDLQEALTVAKIAKDDVDKLQLGLHLATLEVEHARLDKQKVIAEAAQNKEEAGVALAEVQAAKDEAARALEALRVAKSEVQEQSQKIRTLQEDLKVAQQEGCVAKGHTDALLDKLQVTMVESQALQKELVQLRKEVQSSRDKAKLLRSSISMEREQAIAAKDEAHAAKEEAEKIREELNNTKRDEEKAQSANQAAESKLQDVLFELQALKMESACVLQESSQIQNSVEVDCTCIMTVEELENLKTKLHDVEEQLALAMKELENSHANTRDLLKNLDTIKLEKETNEKALIEVHQHLADTEKAKSNMEAEIQRLLDDSKQWHAAKEAIDIPIHSEVIGRSFPSECRDEKPQPDSPDDTLDLSTGSLCRGGNDQEELSEMQETVMKDHMAIRDDYACSSLTRDDFFEKEEGNPKDEVAPHEELASIPTRKKKKTLLVRLGTLLEKKKHSPQQTP